MGINYYPRFYFGIEFSFEDIEHLKETEKFQNLVDENGDDYDLMRTLWLNLDLLYFDSCYGCNEEEVSYIIGVDLLQLKTIDEFMAFDKEAAIQKIKEKCEELELPFKEPGLIEGVHYD